MSWLTGWDNSLRNIAVFCWGGARDTFAERQVFGVAAPRSIAARFAAVALVVTSTALIFAACGSTPKPNLPPPEYERASVIPWDSGTPVDPLEEGGEGDGEWLDDEDPEGAPNAADAGPAADPSQSDAGAPEPDSGPMVDDGGSKASPKAPKPPAKHGPKSPG